MNSFTRSGHIYTEWNDCQQPTKATKFLRIWAENFFNLLPYFQDLGLCDFSVFGLVKEYDRWPEILMQCADLAVYMPLDVGASENPIACLQSTQYNNL
jgi:hypothetical protein